MTPHASDHPFLPAAAGWAKSPDNPVLGGALGTCFDVCVLQARGAFRMWFSWRPQKSIGLVESEDGVRWSAPTIVLGPNPSSGWEQDINRISVVPGADGYRMWYCGQVTSPNRTCIGCATSRDGRTWQRTQSDPVLAPERPWEGEAVMCPHVLWDEALGLYRMWYSAGEQYEPDVIGYATSRDGLIWEKRAAPVFTPDRGSAWECHKVAACQVIPHRGWHLMFYIGFRDVDHAHIGLARSRDGTSDWQRHPANPILAPTPSSWDHDATYKPFALYDEEADLWRLWYNGRRGHLEQIGLALHQGENLGFPSP